MICKNCGKEFEGKYCPECGTAAEEAPKKCSVCGNTREEGQKFCSFCGTNFEQNFKPSGITHTKKQGKEFLRLIPIIILAIFSLLSFIFYALNVGELFEMNLVDYSTRKVNLYDLTSVSSYSGIAIFLIVLAVTGLALSALGAMFLKSDSIKEKTIGIFGSTLKYVDVIGMVSCLFYIIVIIAANVLGGKISDGTFSNESISNINTSSDGIESLYNRGECISFLTVFGIIFAVLSIISVIGNIYYNCRHQSGEKAPCVKFSEEKQAKLNNMSEERQALYQKYEKNYSVLTVAQAVFYITYIGIFLAILFFPFIKREIAALDILEANVGDFIATFGKEDYFESLIPLYFLDIDSIKSYSVGEIILRYGSISSIAQLESDISNGMLQCVSPWSMWISEITQHEFSIYFSVITIVSIILCAVLFFKAVFFGIISLKKLLRRVLNVNKYFNEFDEILYGNFLGAKREMDGLFIKVFFSVTDFLLALGFAYISVHFSTVKTGYNLINSVVIIGVSSLWIGLIVLILLLAIGSFILVRFEEKKIMERR